MSWISRRYNNPLVYAAKNSDQSLVTHKEQFANRIDMDRSYYASIEVGRRNVSLSNLSKIANGFNISIAALMTGVTDKKD